MIQPERSSRTLVLGIDTGGTYTDGVLLDYSRREVLSTFKSLTTRWDYAEGIGKVIEAIEIEDPSEIKMIGISTTLATNSIAEGRGSRVALMLIGYDPDLTSSFKLDQRFGTTQFRYFAGGHDLFGGEREPLDLQGILEYVSTVRGYVDALAISSYFSPLNPEHEERAFEAVSRFCDHPVVLGHQLSTRLGSIERATTAALNASLLGLLRDFVIAVRRASEARGIHAPLMVVRGDGTLMSEEFAARTPVETIHSGPAASAIGGRFISGLDDALIIDVGGTTTDIALIENGQVTISEDGARVGDFKTSVQAANILSVAMGGDSHIYLNREGKLAIGPARVVPLSYLAFQHPETRRRLTPLLMKPSGQVTQDKLEFWFLLREPRPEQLKEGRHARAVVDMLRDAPHSVGDILERQKVMHPLQLGVQDLIRDEIIGRAGVTPTDLLHVEGLHRPWDTEMSEIALKLLCRMRSSQMCDFIPSIWERIATTITQVILTFLTGKQLAPPSLPVDHDLGRWFFRNSLQPADALLETAIRLRVPIIGIGAPSGVFLRRVAEMLHTELILPAHHEVANAVGAVAGSVMVSEEALLYPRFSPDGQDISGYYVQTTEGRSLIESLDEAMRYAYERVRTLAWEGAVRSGAHSPQVTVHQMDDGLDSYRIRARAVGNPRLA